MNILMIRIYMPFDFLKRADLRWNRKLEDMEQLKNLQDELFDAASLYD